MKYAFDIIAILMFFAVCCLAAGGFRVLIDKYPNLARPFNKFHD